MKIIERKQPEGKWWVGKTVECLDCRTLVEIEKSDTPEVSYGYSGWWATFKCPKCKKDKLLIGYT